MLTKIISYLTFAVGIFCMLTDQLDFAVWAVLAAIWMQLDSLDSKK